MKRFFTFCCAILGMGATMYGASADLSEFLNPSDVGDGTSSSFTITTNENGSLKFSGSYTDANEEPNNNSYSVSFDIVAVANTDDQSGTTYTVTMSNFAISGSLSSAFGDNSSVTATATNITSIVVSAGNLDFLTGDALPITIEGQGLGNRTVDISEYLNLLDLLGGVLSSYAQYVTVTMTCTSNATLSIKVDGNEFVSCGFAVAEDGTPSFSADGLENIFDTLTVEGDIVTVLAGEDDITDEVIAKEANVYACSMTFDISALDLSTARYFYVRVVDNNGDSCWNIGFSDVVVTIDGTVYDFSNCTGYGVASYLKLFEEWGDTPVSTTVPSDAQTMVVAFNLYDLWGTWGDSFGEDVIKDYSFVVQINDGAYNQIDAEFFGTELLEGAIYSPTAIASVASDVEVVEVARYNLMGQKISGAEKGINIIVYSDGSAKKVLVK